MFRRHKSTAHSSELLKSRLYDEKSFYKAFVRDLKKAEKSIIIESPFMTERRALHFAELFHRLTNYGVSVRVNTRNPRHHDRVLEAQAWKALFILKDAGVKVRTYDDLRHRKLAIIDDEILWEGSLNVLSQNHSKEMMRRTCSEDLCKQMIAFARLKKIYWP